MPPGAEQAKWQFERTDRFRSSPRGFAANLGGWVLCFQLFRPSAWKPLAIPFAGDGLELGAIALAALHNPDVILMDIRLAQGGSGIDAAREIYTHQALRCIFLSANLDEPTKTALLPDEPIDFVGKPVLPIVLQ